MKQYILGREGNFDIVQTRDMNSVSTDLFNLLVSMSGSDTTTKNQAQNRFWYSEKLLICW